MGNPNQNLLIKPKIVKAKVKMPILFALAIVWMLSIDFFTRVPAGPLSISGAMTLAGAGLCFLLAPALLHYQLRRDEHKRAGVPLALTLFLIYAVVNLAVHPSAEGLQNVAVYATFILAVGLTSAQASPESTAKVLRWMRYVAVLTSLAYLAATAAGFYLYSDRAFALAALISLAILIPYKPKNRIYRLAPFIVAAAVAASLSRTATAIAVIMLVFMAVRGRRGFRALLGATLAGAAAVLAYWLFTSYAPLRDRFIGGDSGATIGNFELNTSGRTTLWEITIASAEKSPMFGAGAGSASELIRPMFREISHPHNEYLRLFHDFGYFGAVLFVLGTLALVVRSLQMTRRSDNPVHWSAALGLIAVLGAALTDNVIIYPFVMVPLGLLAGASIGTIDYEQPRAKKVPARKLSPAYRRLQIDRD